MSDSEPRQGQAFDRELSRRIVRGSAWVGLGYGGRQILAFASTLVLVRLLDPKAFGTVAVGMSLLAIVSQIQESGLGSALVYQRHRDTTEAASSVFVFAASAGFALTAVTVALAPLYTRLLNVPEAAEFLQVLALLLTVRGLSVVPGAMLERELDFRSRTRAELAGAIVQVTVAIACAVAGLGAWSLVAGLLSGAAAQSTVLWLRAAWHPSLRAASWSTLRELLRYGRFVSGANMMVIVNGNLDTVVVARLLGTASLGAYNLAWRLAALPVTFLGAIVGRVMFSVYSRLQHDLDAVRAAYVQNLQRGVLFGLPLTATLGIAAEPIVLGLLGPEWHAAIGPLRVLSILCFVRLLIAPSGDLFRGIGRPHLTMIAAIAFFVVALPAVLVLVRWLGLTGAALGMVTGSMASGAVLLTSTFRVLSLRPSELARALARPIACGTIVAAALCGLVPLTTDLSAIGALVVVVVVGAAIYVAAVGLLARSIVTPIVADLRRA